MSPPRRSRWSPSARSRGKATAAGLTTGTLGAFTVVHGAAADIALTGSTANLASGHDPRADRDAAGCGGQHGVMSDNTTVITFGKQSGAGSVTGTGTATAASGVATKTITGALVGSVTMEATAAGLTTGSRAFHGRPRRGDGHRALRIDREPHLRRDAPSRRSVTIRDAAGNTVTSDKAPPSSRSASSPAPAPSPHRHRDRHHRRRDEDDDRAVVGSVTMEATAAGLTTGTLGAFTVVHGAAADIVLTGATTNLTSGATRVSRRRLRMRRATRSPLTTRPSSRSPRPPAAGTVTGTGNTTAIVGVARRLITGALVGSVTMEPPRVGLTTGTLGASPSSRRSQRNRNHRVDDNLTSGTTRVLTATIQDAAGNTVTADSTTVVTFAEQSGAGTVTGAGTATAASGVATKTITGQLVGPVTMEATAAGAHDRHPRLVHRRPWSGRRHRPHRRHHQPHLRRDPRPDGENSGRRWEHRHRRQHHRHYLCQGASPAPATATGTGTATATSGVATKTITGQLVGDDDGVTAAGLTTGTLGAFTVVHGAAADIVLDLGPTANLTSELRGCSRRRSAMPPETPSPPTTSTVIAFGKQSAGTVTASWNAIVTAVATKTITGQLVGSVTMEATAAGLTTGTLAPFTVVHGAGAQIALHGSHHQT